MRVPGLHDAHIRLDDRHPGLDQAPGQEQRLAVAVPAVAVADGGGLAFELEGARHAARGQDRERLLLLTGELAGTAQRARREALAVDLLEERATIAQPADADAGGKPQAVDAEGR